jgi:hypothetical protein
MMLSQAIQMDIDDEPDFEEECKRLRRKVYALQYDLNKEREKDGRGEVKFQQALGVIHTFLAVGDHFIYADARKKAFDRLEQWRTQ